MVRLAHHDVPGEVHCHFAARTGGRSPYEVFTVARGPAVQVGDDDVPVVRCTLYVVPTQPVEVIVGAVRRRSRDRGAARVARVARVAPEAEAVEAIAAGPMGPPAGKAVAPARVPHGQ